MRSWTPRIAIYAIAATLLAGCATLERSQARDTEHLLAAAGFKAQPMDAADQQTPPNKVVRRTRNGLVEYVYADPQNCKCVYVGGPKEYSEYRRLDMEHLARQQATDDPWAPCDYQGLCWPW